MGERESVRSLKVEVLCLAAAPLSTLLRATRGRDEALCRVRNVDIGKRSAFGNKFNDRGERDLQH